MLTLSPELGTHTFLQSSKPSVVIMRSMYALWVSTMCPSVVFSSVMPK